MSQAGGTAPAVAEPVESYGRARRHRAFRRRLEENRPDDAVVGEQDMGLRNGLDTGSNGRSDERGCVDRSNELPGAGRADEDETNSWSDPEQPRICEEHAREFRRRHEKRAKAASGADRNSSAHSGGAAAETAQDHHRNPSAHSGGPAAEPGHHRNPSVRFEGPAAEPDHHRNSSAHFEGPAAESAEDQQRNSSAHSGGAAAETAQDHHRNPSAHSSDHDQLDPHAITAQLESLVRARKDWDSLLGPLAWAMKEHKLWRHLDTTPKAAV